MTIAKTHKKFEWPPLVADFKIDVQKSAILIVDLQNFTCSPYHGWGPVLKANYPNLFRYYYTRMERYVLPNTVELLAWGRRSGARCVYFTIGSYFDDRAELSPLRNTVGQRGESSKIPIVGTVAHHIPGLIRPMDGDLILNKITKSAFNSTPIDIILKNLGIEFILVCGALTDSCVDFTARDAADRAYKTTLVSDCCATFDPVAQANALDSFSRIFGKVVMTEELTGKDISITRSTADE